MVGAGWRAEEVYDLPLDVLNLYIDSVERREAVRRSGYIADTSASVAHALVGPDAIRDHIAAIDKLISGET